MLFTLQHIHSESLCSTGVEIKIQLLTVSVKLSSEDAASISNVCSQTEAIITNNHLHSFQYNSIQKYKVNDITLFKSIKLIQLH